MVQMVQKAGQVADFQERIQKEVAWREFRLFKIS